MDNSIEVITDPLRIKEITKELHEINQLIKKVYNNIGYYHFENGCFYSYNKKQLPQLLIAKINDKCDLEWFDGKEFTISCKELFDYDIKKVVKGTRDPEIKEIIYDYNTKTLTFSRIYNKLELPYKPESVDGINEFIEIIDKFNNKLGTYVMDEDLLKALKNSNDPINIIIPLDEKICYNKNDIEIGEDDNFLSFLVSNKFFIGNNSNTKKGETVFNYAEITIFNNEEIEDIYALSVLFKEKFIDIEQYFILTDIIKPTN